MSNSINNMTVLVTGVSGYIASRVTLDLLESGYRVRGTVRSQSAGEELRRALAPHTDRLDRLELVEADLTGDEGWDAAVRGCAFVQHIASPFPLENPEDASELVVPAVEGTRRVLAAAARQGVRRVVLTSSVAAVSHGYNGRTEPFTEADWSVIDYQIDSYSRSKTLAEQAAWEFIESLPPEHPLELAVINPGFVIGPVLDDRDKTSAELHKTYLEAKVPGVAPIKFNLVDVRDVSRAHLAAMTTPQAAGKRFVCVGGGMWLPEFVEILAAHFWPQGYNVPTMRFPGWFLRVYALFDKNARRTVDQLNRDTRFDTSRIREVLDWEPIPLQESIVEMGESLIVHGAVRAPK